MTEHSYKYFSFKNLLFNIKQQQAKYVIVERFSTCVLIFKSYDLIKILMENIGKKLKKKKEKL